jgi:hypothetical protein
MCGLKVRQVKKTLFTEHVTLRGNTVLYESLQNWSVLRLPMSFIP